MRRSIAVLTLLLHTVLIGAGPVVDARMELVSIGGADHSLHVEDADGPPCGSGHHHDFCLIRGLQQVDISASDSATRFSVHLSPSPVVSPSATVPHRRGQGSPPPARAPPAA